MQAIAFLGEEPPQLQRERFIKVRGDVPCTDTASDGGCVVQFDGADSGVTYNNFSPRLGLTYDLRGNGKTVLKANFARYYGIGIYTAGTLSPTGSTTLRYGWSDRNGDLVVQRDELEFARGFLATPTSNYNPANPSAVTTPASSPCSRIVSGATPPEIGTRSTRPPFASSR